MWYIQLSGTSAFNTLQFHLSFHYANYFITCTDLSEPLSPPVSIIHCSHKVFQATSCINTELLYIGSSWSSYLCSSMWQEYIAYEFILTSLAVSHMSSSSNLNSFRDRWPYSCCFVGFCLQDLFNTAHNILA